MLVSEAPRIVGTDELVDRVWGVEHVSSASIRQVVSELRQALGDPAARPEILQTVHRRGYRLIAPVERVDLAAEPPEAAPDDDRRWPRRLAIGAAALVLAGFGWWMGNGQRRFVEAERIAHGSRVDEPDSAPEELPAKTLRTLLRIHLETGRLQEAEETLEQLEAAAAGDPSREAKFTAFRALWLERTGRFAESRAAYRSAVRQFTALGDRTGVANQLNRWGSLLDQIGEADAAADLLERAVQLGEEAGSQLTLVVSRCLAAPVYARLGRLEEARLQVDQALEWSAETDDDQRTALCLRASASVLAAEERLPEAEERFRQALEVSLGAADVSGASEAYHGLGSVTRQTGQPELARVYLERAAAGFEQLSILTRWLDSRCAIAEIELESGDLELAGRLFEEALERSAEWSLELYAARAGAGLAAVAERSAAAGRRPRPAGGQP